MDSLRLPTVPAPAVATHPWRDRVLIAAMAFLAAGTYNPFIYFRF